MTMGGNSLTEEIISKGLCNGCGTCYAVCPQNAIEIVPDERLGIFTAVMNPAECSDCGKCEQVCHSYDTLVRGNFLKDGLTGSYRQVFSGYSTDDRVRCAASSGGVITSLLHYLMEKKEISGCILVRPSGNTALLHEPFISMDNRDINTYTGTRYFPIPVNRILCELKKREGKFVIIGTPCQIHSVRLAERNDPQLQSRIYLRISVFCGGTPNINAHRYYMQQHGIDEKQVRSICRCQGWPGYNVFQCGGNNLFRISKRPEKWIHRVYHTIAFFPLFLVKRCLLCNDRFGASSDISVGDAWLERFSDDQKGTSLIISRSERADDLLLRMKKEKFLELGPVTGEELIASQKIFSEFYRNFQKTFSIMRGKELAARFHFDPGTGNDTFWGLKLYLLLTGWRLSRKEYVWRVLVIYGIIFRFLWRIL